MRSERGYFVRKVLNQSFPLELVLAFSCNLGEPSVEEEQYMINTARDLFKKYYFT
jgi:hypothetical protein